MTAHKHSHDPRTICSQDADRNPAQKTRGFDTPGWGVRQREGDDASRRVLFLPCPPVARHKSHCDHHPSITPPFVICVVVVPLVAIAPAIPAFPYPGGGAAAAAATASTASRVGWSGGSGEGEVLDGEGPFSDKDVGTWFLVAGVVVPHLQRVGRGFSGEIKRDLLLLRCMNPLPFVSCWCCLSLFKDSRHEQVGCHFFGECRYFLLLRTTYETTVVVVVVALVSYLCGFNHGRKYWAR